MYHHKSGAQKRKDFALREHNIAIAKRGQTSIENFMKPSSSRIQNINAENVDEKENFDPICEIVPPKVNSTTTNAQNLVELVSCDPENEGTVTAEDFVSCDPENEGPATAEDFSSKEEVEDSAEHLPQQQSSFDNYDIGIEEAEYLRPQTVDKIIRRGHQGMPSSLPRDSKDYPFPMSILCKTMPNGEKVQRDWLVWSTCKSSLFCFPCSVPATNRVPNYPLLKGFRTGRNYMKKFQHTKTVRITCSAT